MKKSTACPHCDFSKPVNPEKAVNLLASHMSGMTNSVRDFGQYRNKPDKSEMKPASFRYSVEMKPASFRYIGFSVEIQPASFR